MCDAIVTTIKDLTPLALGLATLLGGWITSWRIIFKTKTILQQMFLSLDEKNEFSGSVCYNTFNFPDNLENGAVADCHLHIHFSNPDKSVMKVESKWHFIKFKDTKNRIEEYKKLQAKIMVNGVLTALTQKNFNKIFEDVKWEEYITKSELESKIILHRKISFDRTLLLLKGIKISIRLIDSYNRKTKWSTQTLWIHKDSRKEKGDKNDQQ